MARARWADLVDSSQEGPVDEEPPKALLADDSYLGEPDPELESSKRGLNSRLMGSAALETGPKDFAFLLTSAEFEAKDRPAQGGLDCVATTALVASPSSPAKFTPFLSNPSQFPTADDFQASASPFGPRPSRQKRTQTFTGSLVQVPAGKRPKGAVSEEIHKSVGSSAIALADQHHSDTSAPATLHSLPVIDAGTATQSTLPPASEEDWQHREEKRRRALVIVKATPEYTAYVAARHPTDRLKYEPRTPDATDRAMSKRRWEQEVQQWRAALRGWCEEYGVLDQSGT